LETVPFQSTVEQFDWQQQRQQRARGHRNGEGIELGAEAMSARSENRHRRAAAFKIMEIMLSLKSSKAVSINSARHFHSSISISPGTRRIRADGRQHESKQRLRRHGQARRAHTEHPVRHVWPLRTLERSHRP
jgi:hypothetical protein